MHQAVICSIDLIKTVTVLIISVHSYKKIEMGIRQWIDRHELYRIKLHDQYDLKIISNTYENIFEQLKEPIMLFLH